MKLFQFVQHIGRYRVLVQTRDIADKAITGKKIADKAIDWCHIISKAIRNGHIADKAVDDRTLADGAVTNAKIGNGAVTPDKMADGLLERLFEALLEPLRAKDADLQNQIDSFNEHGVSVSNEFGDDPHIGVSQKTLTDAFNRLWSKMEDITGETLHGISMAVSPTYYIGEDGCTVHIAANTADATGIFEHIAFYINGALVCEGHNVDFFEYDTEIDETAVVMCRAKILGIEYEAQKTVTHYGSFWLGAGAAYADVMDVSHVIPIARGMRGAYDVAVADGDHLIVIVGETLRERFIRADINGSEIAFAESQVTVDGHRYSVFVSQNTYQAGTYNVDING